MCGTCSPSSCPRASRRSTRSDGLSSRTLPEASGRRTHCDVEIWQRRAVASGAPSFVQTKGTPT
jgi:hypothetical protein